MTMAAATPDDRPVFLHAQDPAVLAWAEAFCRAVGRRAAEAGAPAVPALRPEPAASAEAVAAAATAAPEAGAAAPLGWLIYTPPSWAGLRGGAAALPAWEAAHAPMLRTATLNPALRLVNVLALLHAPEALAAHLLDGPAEALELSPLTLDRGALGPLAAELAPRGGEPAALQAEALYQSLEAMASLDGEALGLAAAERAAAAAELRDLRQALADAAQERTRRDAEQAAQAAREDGLLKLQLQQMQQELEAQLQAQREAEQRQRAAEQEAASRAEALAAREDELAQAREAADAARRAGDERLAAAADEAAREHGLLQAQLRQAQEELALQWQAQREAVETLLATKEARAAAEAERDRHAQALAELRARPPVDPGLVQRLAASEAEAARLAAEARERTAERDAARQAQADLSARAARLEAELQPLREAAAASQQEADLLLSQLHQVQEEFEAVFFRQRDEAQQARAVAQARDALAQERDALLAERAAWAGERNTLLGERDGARRERDSLTGERDAARRERDTLATERQALLAERAAGTADRDALTRELAQRRAEAEAQRAQLEGQVQQLAQEIEQQRIERALAVGAADERLQLAERQREALLRDSEGLLLQIQQLREELELYYRRHRSLQEAEESRRHQLRRLRAHAHALQPDTLRIDLRRAIDGEGWHEAEPDGRWTGPATSSRLHLPGLAAGAYHVQLDIVDALAPDVLDGASLAIAGVPVRLEALEPGFPARLMGLVELPDDGALEWELRLDTPRVLTPRETSGLPDDRLLGLRVRSLALTRLA